MKAIIKKRFLLGPLFLCLLIQLKAFTLNAKEYYFVTRWQFATTADKIWPVIMDVEGWPSWWRGVDVQLLDRGDPDGKGAVAAFTWRGFAGYKLRCTMTTLNVVHLRSIEAQASGDLEGYGEWTFGQVGDDSVWIEYHWQVRTTKKWMNDWAFLLQPIFRASHNQVMRKGYKGLQKYLSVEVF